VPDFEEATIMALHRGVKFRVLLLDPDSTMVRVLSRGKAKAGTLATELRSSIQSWRKIQSRSGMDLLAIGLYDGLPSFVMVGDDRLYVASYLDSDMVEASPCLEIAAGVEIFQTYRFHFDRIWSSSKRLSG
jgi:hypothetical protein